MVQVSGDALQLASANTLSSFKVDAIGPSKDLTVDITCKHELHWQTLQFYVKITNSTFAIRAGFFYK